MHLVSEALVVEGAVCIAGAACMAYWMRRAMPDPYDVCEVCGSVHGEGLGDFPRAAGLSVETWRYWLVKRSIDIVCSLVLLVAVFLPGCAIALFIVLTSKGPIFYREQRIGRYGNLFRIWKFRSMYQQEEWPKRVAGRHDAQNVLSWRVNKTLKDPRITKVGGFLRRWSLDELPQLLNILAGDMSLIGPRPIIEAEIDVYGQLLDLYLEVNPGLSGLWQVSGRSDIGYEQRAKLDSRYVKDWTLKGDFHIFLRTFPVVLKRIGAR